uniref:Nodule-specific cysteine-rich peptide 122 n=1 Tax=Medicago truncatula TaxID=3880 RepID=A7KH94_MEDTR|nr:nodule-specific cysteine-rich peptide 122 [Medicago truncatula]
MAVILKFVYIMIIFLFLLYVVNGTRCNRDEDCPFICTGPQIPKCVSHICFCLSSGKEAY